MAKISVGLIAFLIKFGLAFFTIFIKFAAVLAKLIKGAGGVKMGLAAASFGAYSIIIDWRFAVFLMVMLGIHESGHVWAMKRVGMKTRGFYFIPIFGGMAVPESDFPSPYAEGYVALMGPLWGLFVTLATIAIYLLTGDRMWIIHKSSGEITHHSVY